MLVDVLNCPREFLNQDGKNALERLSWLKIVGVFRLRRPVRKRTGVLAQDDNLKNKTAPAGRMPGSFAQRGLAVQAATAAITCSEMVVSTLNVFTTTGMIR